MVGVLPDTLPALAELLWLLGEALAVPVLALVLPSSAAGVTLAAVLAAFTWLGWVWRGLAVLVLVASLTLLMGLSWGSAEEGHGHVRFMTYNVKSYLALKRPGGAEELAHEILEHQPDILVMQDAGQLVDVEGNVKSADLLRVVGGGWQHAHAIDEYVVLSRWPIKQCHHGAIPVGDDPHVFAHCDIDVDGTTLQVITVHLNNIPLLSGLSPQVLQQV